jgi:DNA-binding FadR family transcriptional regulator
MSAVLSRTDEVTDTLRTEILRGQYRAGERLPSERELAARFEANRGVIREAIKKLEQLGIVAVNPGGVRIQPLEEATLDILGHLLELDENTRPDLLSQTMDVMASMLALSARSAVEMASDEQLDQIKVLVNTLVESVGNQERHHENWMAFSEYLQSVHGNLVLRLVGNGLRTQFLGRTQQQGNFNPDPAARKEALQGLLTAAAVRDINQVAITIRSHFDVIRMGILQATEAAAEIRRSGNG